MNERDDSDLEARLRALPRGLEPGQDLWSGIASRVDASKREAAAKALRARRASRVRWIGGSAFAAAASIALVLGSVSRLHHRGAGNVAPSGSMAAVVSTAPPESTPLPGTPREPIIPEEASYRAALADLGTSFMQNRGNLPPASAKVIDDNVRMLEHAVEATRAALAANPGNQELRAQLRDEYQQEIDVLQDVIDLSTRT